jgi:hypothetical protein
VIKNIKLVCQNTGVVPLEFVPDPENLFRTTTDYVRILTQPIDAFNSCKEAFNLAIGIEKMVGLSLYKLIYNGKRSVLGNKVLKKINYAETGHINQLKKYMELREDCI